MANLIRGGFKVEAPNVQHFKKIEPGVPLSSIIANEDNTENEYKPSNTSHRISVVESDIKEGHLCTTNQGTSVGKYNYSLWPKTITV